MIFSLSKAHRQPEICGFMEAIDYASSVHEGLHHLAVEARPTLKKSSILGLRIASHRQAQDHFENSDAPMMVSQKRLTTNLRYMEAEHALMMQSIVGGKKHVRHSRHFLLRKHW